MSADPASPTPSLGQWVPTKEAAAHIRVHPEVLRRWAREGDKHPWLPRPRRIGKDFRWDLIALDAAMEDLSG